MSPAAERSDTLLDEVLEANREFAAGKPASRPMLLGTGKLLVLTCADPRLTTLLPRATGVRPEEMIQVRNSGARAGEEALRSLTVGLLLCGATEVFVVGHTDCRLCRVTAMELLGAMARAGVSRAAFGGKEPREWIGAMGSERQGALEAVRAARKFPGLPPGTPVHALLVDTTTGKLELIERGYAAPSATKYSDRPAAAPPAPAPPAPPAQPKLEDLESRAPPSTAAPPPLPPRKPLGALGRAGDVLRKLRAKK